MKRSLLLFLLAAGCCLSSGCRSKERAAGGAGNAGSEKGSNAAERPSKTDVVFAREAVEALLGGDAEVAADAFDWENLKVPGMDVGESYREMPEDENADEVRREFIDNFSGSFKESGASASDLKNWREQSKEGERTIVAADTTTGKIMRIAVVRRDGRQLVSELSIE